MGAVGKAASIASDAKRESMVVFARTGAYW
jgi:hypothetical protein